jgi:hypothetical protein
MKALMCLSGRRKVVGSCVLFRKGFVGRQLCAFLVGVGGRHLCGFLLGGLY